MSIKKVLESVSNYLENATEDEILKEYEIIQLCVAEDDSEGLPHNLSIAHYLLPLYEAKVAALSKQKEGSENE